MNMIAMSTMAMKKTHNKTIHQMTTKKMACLLQMSIAQHMTWIEMEKKSLEGSNLKCKI
jgi:hypothetical protein